VSDVERLSSEEVSAYVGAVEWVEALIGSDEIGHAWSSPSALTRYSTGGLAAHAVGGVVLRLLQVLDEPPPVGARRTDVAEAFGPNRMEGPEDDDPLFVTLREGYEQLAERGQAALLETCAVPFTRLRELLPHAEADRAVPMVRVPDGQLSLRDYLRTRVLEAVVHGDDLVASVPGWQPPAPPADAVTVCLDICLELAVARVGGTSALRAFTRSERAEPDALRVL
jgi:hypothetical protein